MQNNVNAENVFNCLTTSFGSDNVRILENGNIRLKVKSMGNGDILNISNMLLMADIQIRRSDKNIVAIFVPR